MIDRKTYGEWRDVYNRAPYGSKAEYAALEKMAAFARTFDEWRCIFRRAPEGSELWETALAKITE